MRDFEYIHGVSTLVLDQDICIGCSLCTQVCPHVIFVIHGSKAFIRDLDECMECGACSLNCPVKAISVNADVGCASGMINRWLAGFNIRFNSNESGC